MDERVVKLALDAVERMIRMFQGERVIYLGSATAAVGLLVYAAFKIISAPEFQLESAGLMFGAGGLFAVSGARVIFLLNRTYDLTEDLIRKLGGLDPRSGG